MNLLHLHNKYVHWQITTALSQRIISWLPVTLGHACKLGSPPVQLTIVSLGGRPSSLNSRPPSPIAPGDVTETWWIPPQWYRLDK